MLQAGFIYNSIMSKKKERFDIILEPLQAFIQLALLSFTPVDSKLNIYNNVLYIQIPGWKQTIMRTYYSDSKNDLFYLFNVMNRFNKFYQHLETIKNDNTNLFVLLKELSTKGLDNLLQTYKQTENPALLHTLNIYKNILNGLNGLNNPINPDAIPGLNEQMFLSQNSDIYKSSQSSPTSPASSRSISPTQSRVSRTPSSNHNQLSLHNNIDDIFINITKLYSEYDYLIIFNTLELIQNNPNNYLDYMEGLNKILEPINKQIQKWVVDNIVY